jgi:hypothetical protein
MIVRFKTLNNLKVSQSFVSSETFFFRRLFEL